VQVATQVRGVGPILAGGIVAFVDIERTPHAVNLWSLMGYAIFTERITGRMLAEWTKRTTPTEAQTEAEVKKLRALHGKPVRRVAGHRLTYNAQAKRNCYLLGRSLINPRWGGAYFDLFEEYKPMYLMRDYSKGHAHMAAMRVVIKLWLSHLYETWRTLEGLEASKPYIFEVPADRHDYATGYLSPAMFGWPQL